MNGRIKLAIKSRGISIIGTEEEWPCGDAGEGPSSSSVVMGFCLGAVLDDDSPLNERLLIMILG
jgi:hypothetical protein